jgi:hypothetical protein
VSAQPSAAAALSSCAPPPEPRSHDDATHDGEDKLPAASAKFDPAKLPLLDVLRAHVIAPPAHIPGEPADVFISHAGTSKPLAFHLWLLLRVFGVTAFLDQAELPAAGAAVELMAHNINSAKFGVIILDQQFMNREWPVAEACTLLQRAAAGACKLFPVFLTRQWMPPKDSKDNPQEKHKYVLAEHLQGHTGVPADILHDPFNPLDHQLRMVGPWLLEACGLHKSQADVERAVEIVLKEAPKWSNGVVTVGRLKDAVDECQRIFQTEVAAAQHSIDTLRSHAIAAVPPVYGQSSELFICHTVTNKSLALRIWLILRTFDVSAFMDWACVPPRSIIGHVIARHLHSVKLGVVLLDAEFMNHAQVQKQVITLLCRSPSHECKLFPVFLVTDEQWQPASFLQGQPEQAQAHKHALAAHLKKWSGVQLPVNSSQQAQLTAIARPLLSACGTKATKDAVTSAVDIVCAAADKMEDDDFDALQELSKWCRQTFLQRQLPPQQAIQPGSQAAAAASSSSSAMQAEAAMHARFEQLFNADSYQKALSFLQREANQHAAYESKRERDAQCKPAVGWEAYVQDVMTDAHNRDERTQESCALLDARNATRKALWDVMHEECDSMGVRLLDPTNRKRPWCNRARTMLKLLLPLDRANYYGRELHNDEHKLPGERLFHEHDNCPEVYKWMHDNYARTTDADYTTFDSIASTRTGNLTTPACIWTQSSAVRS